MSNATVNKNSDFLFIYEAIMCNPNGDPDMENKPRMDYDTKTNLVSDVRIKRYIRDYLKTQGRQIFVDMEGDRKVSAETRLKNIISGIVTDNSQLNKLLQENAELKSSWEEMISKAKNDAEKNYETFKTLSKNKDRKKDFEKPFDKFNNELLKTIVTSNLLDIRMFGGAFAVEGFNKTYTGPIQINWGYSLNDAELIKANSIVTIMNDDNSTFGKDHRLYYSLLAFHGTVNKYFAKQTSLTEDDLKAFRQAIYDAIPALPTRSKLEQYPVLYFEIQYKEGYNGYLRDLRNWVNCESQTEHVRSLDDLSLTFDDLIEQVNKNKAVIEKVYIGKNERCNFDESRLQVPVEFITPYAVLA